MDKTDAVLGGEEVRQSMKGESNEQGAAGSPHPFGSAVESLGNRPGGSNKTVVALLGLVVILLAAIAGILFFLSRTPSDLSLPPGKGKSIADAAYLVVKPVAGETLTPPVRGHPTTPQESSADAASVNSRLYSALAVNPGWKLEPTNEKDDTVGSLFYKSFRFLDGSVLTFVGSPADGQSNLAGLGLATVRVRRSVSLADFLRSP